MNMLLKLIALERQICESIPSDKRQLPRRLAILDQILEYTKDVQLDHTNTAFDQQSGIQNYSIKDSDFFVKNVGCFFRSLASNLNSIADKD